MWTLLESVHENLPVVAFVAFLNLAVGFHSNWHVLFCVITECGKQQIQKKVFSVDLFTNQISFLVILFFCFTLILTSKASLSLWLQ